jgi:hypothetical protein
MGTMTMFNRLLWVGCRACGDQVAIAFIGRTALSLKSLAAPGPLRYHPAIAWFLLDAQGWLIDGCLNFSPPIFSHRERRPAVQ